MKTSQKALAWGMGILVWMNLLSILLSAWQFGYVDWTTVAHMGTIVVPLLAIGTFLLHHFRVGGEVASRDEALVARRVSRTRAPVGAGR